MAEKRDLGGALGLVTQGLIYTKLMAILLVRNGEDMKIGARFFWNQVISLALACAVWETFGGETFGRVANSKSMTGGGN